MSVLPMWVSVALQETGQAGLPASGGRAGAPSAAVEALDPWAGTV